MKIISWNVNGIRSVFRTTFQGWLKVADPDIVCIQETKADYTILGKEYTEIDGYYAYFHSSSLKKGHSGVAVYTKIKPLKIETKLGIDRFDDEGRCLKLTFKDFILFNFYIPNGARDQHDIPYKLEVYRQLFPILEEVMIDEKGNKTKEVILAGDFNIAHTELDVFHAKANKKNTMFTPAERAQLDTLTNLGYVDSFRKKYPEKKSYSWWPYMLDLRERDIGWRIDYLYVSPVLAHKIEDAITYREILGSDHGPIGLILNKEIEVDATERPVYIKEEPQSGLF